MMRKLILLAVLLVAGVAYAQVQYQSVTFEGTCIDQEDGDISDQIEWSSDLDGYIFTGATGTYDIREGTHVIRATCTDSMGAEVFAEVTYDTNDPPIVTIILPAQG
jgi:hypothetical protein